MGQGLALDAAVANYLGISHKRHRAPCAHRSAGYLSGVPERFVQKYAPFYHALSCRMLHALDGRGAHSFDSLRALSIELAEPETVVCALFLTVHCHAAVAPLMLRSQDTNDLPWCRWRACMDEKPRLLETRFRLRVWRERLRAVVLLVPYLRRSDAVSLRRLWAAWCFSKDAQGLHVRGKTHLPAALFHIPFSGQF